MTAELISLDGATYRDVVTALRSIADDLEKEGCKGVEACLVVGANPAAGEHAPRVFGLGYGDAGTSHLLLHAGQLKLALTLL